MGTVTILGRAYDTVTLPDGREWITSNLHAYGTGPRYPADHVTNPDLRAALDEYGALYLREEVEALPLSDGWRLPTPGEMQYAAEYGTTYSSLKRTTTGSWNDGGAPWNPPNTGAEGELGLDLQGAGSYLSDYWQSDVGLYGYLWLSGETVFYLSYSTGAGFQPDNSARRCAVRLVRYQGRAPLVQTVVPQKTAAGWRVYMSGWNLDLVLGAQFGNLPLVTPTVQTARSLEFILPGIMPAGQYPIRLGGSFGELELRGLTVVDLVDLDNYRPTPYTAPEYASQLLELLPKGPAWARRKGTNFWKLFSACAEELARVHAAALHLLDELTPSQTVDSLAEWETELGLPEPGVVVPATDDESRRKEIFRKANSLGGSSAAYFETLAAAYGFDIRVEELYPLAHPFTAGRGAAGDPLFHGKWSFAWKVTGTDPSRETELRTWLNRLKPAHTVVWLVFEPLEEIAMVGDTGDPFGGSTGDTTGGVET